MNRMMVWMGARLGTPSKRSELSDAQEQIRWQMTIMGHDNAIWRAAFASEEELSHFVADPKRFINRRKETFCCTQMSLPFG